MNERIPVLKRETEAPRRRGGKLLAVVLALFAIVLVILFFRSSLSKVTEIQVAGIYHLSEAEVKEALGVAPGDSFFTPGSGKLAANVQALPIVKQVQVFKKFPGVVEVRIQEYAEVAMELGTDGALKVVLENGLSLPAKSEQLPDKPILTGWEPEAAARAALCQTLAAIPSAFLTDLSEIKPDPSQSYPDKIKLFTRSGFEVVTTVSKLVDKIPYLSEIIENREPGTIVMLEADTFLPFSAQIAPAGTEEADKHKEIGTTQ